MKLTQVIEEGAARANDLFSKLAETGSGAIKTRERLWGDLKPELELMVRIDQEHLFPILRKNSEMRDLVKDAAKDNDAVLALVRELESLPKEGDAFLEKVIEARRAFQRSIRDDKKQLLPAIRKVLSNEDEQGLAEKVAETRSRAGEEEAQRRRALEQAREQISQVGRAAGRAMDGGAAAAGKAMEGAQQSLDIAGQLPRVAMDAIGETGRLLSDLTSRTAESGQRASRDIMRCGTPLQAAVVQARLVREMTEVWMDTSTRMVEISMRASQDMIFPQGRDARD